MIEAVKSCSLAGRSRHSSGQGGARKPIAPRGHMAGYSTTRGAMCNLIHREKAARRCWNRGKGFSRRGIENPPEGKPDTPEGGPNLITATDRQT